MAENHAQYECFICFEVSNEYEKHPSRLNNLENYIKNCSCDGWIHNTCIKKWYKSNETCPICRKKIVFLNFDLQYGIYIIHYFVVTTNSLYIFIKHLIKLKNIIIFCIILTNIMNIVSIALHNFHKNDTCSDYIYQYKHHYYYLEYVYDADQIL